MYTNGLRKIRETVDCSQSEFADALMVGRINYNNWEWAKAYPSPKFRRQITATLKITPGELAHLLTTQADDYTPPKRLIERVIGLLPPTP